MAKRESNNTRMAKKSLAPIKTILPYFIGFLIPPILAGILSTLSFVRDTFVHTLPPIELTSEELSAKPLKHSPSLPQAVIVLGKSGTQITEALGAYDVLSQSGLFDVYAAADKLALLPTTGFLGVIPDVTFSQIKQVDLLVLPSVLDSKEPALLEFIRTWAPQAKLTVVLGEGIRGLLRSEAVTLTQASTHFLALSDLQSSYSQIRFQTIRSVKEDNVLTSPGLVASYPALLEAVAFFSDTQKGKKLADTLGLTDLSPFQTPLPPPKDIPSLTFWDLFRVFWLTSFGWDRLKTAVFLYPGVSEIGLANCVDSLPRTFAAKMVTIGKRRAPLLTRNGLRVVPYLSIPETPDDLDLLLLPPGKPLTLERDSEIQAWIRQSSSKMKDFTTVKPGGSFYENLKLIEKIFDRPTVNWVAKLTQFPSALLWEAPTTKTKTSWILVLCPLALGLVGVFLTSALLRKYRDSYK